MVECHSVGRPLHTPPAPGNVLHAQPACCFHVTQAKAYTTRVGAGPYPTEIFGDLAENLREIGREYGTTTGRPRRIGWIDMVALKFASRWEPCVWLKRLGWVVRRVVLCKPTAVCVLGRGWQLGALPHSAMRWP